jgi:hypothetical protein
VYQFDPNPEADARSLARFPRPRVVLRLVVAPDWERVMNSVGLPRSTT